VPHRFLGAMLAALAAAVLLAAGVRVETRAQWVSEEGYDWWTGCYEVPDDISFLPVYLPNEAQTYVDLGRNIELENGRQWRAVQATRDKDLGATRAVTGTWYAGMGSEEWPPRSVNVRAQLNAFRVVSYEINGNRHAVDASCVIVYATSDETIGFYNAWVRFTEPGLHTLKITGRQLFDYPFIFPFLQTGTTDPLGLDGRRIFVQGEAVGDTLDGDLVHTYELHVARGQGR
jgi:hypothetical protein